MTISKKITISAESACLYNNLCPITVTRYSHNSTCTLSRVEFDGLIFQGLEPTDHIPSGSYLMRLTTSPKFSAKYPYHKHPHNYVPIVCGVPNYEGIRIHCGNYPSDTIGCLLLGMSTNGVSINRSAIAYDHFLDRIWLLKNQNPNIFFVINYIDEYE